MVGGIHTHLDDMLASQYQSIDWTQHTTCQPHQRMNTMNIYWATRLSLFSGGVPSKAHPSTYSVFGQTIY